ncbi:MAG: DNA polymerase III subunit gamma/tau [Gammaproteobacteria bacterium]|nr:DNA polymerase III subunit gamma/tau [Gammaproteobacteria bacterium]
MSYQVLARKWRPKNFSEMVGQEHVLRALINALDSDRLHHAFLFTGTRGVGKTTIARILAKSLNCEQGTSSTPCGECSACTEIDEGRFVDLIEVDAASRTKVEDTRDLLDNVQYAPSRGRYKVYLIDEVHMLSNHSFNALLKTLEEPPPHVKFLLATTDPQKLPVTILSRCLQFNLRRLSTEMIRDHLQFITNSEQVEAESTALQQLAHAADGSMRDALSLLDQAIAFGGGSLQSSDVQSMLGTIEKTYIYQILAALAQADCRAALQQVQELSMQAPDYTEVLAELITTLHHIALLQLVPESWDESMGDQARLQELAVALSPEDVQLFYQTALIGRRDIHLAPDARNGLEMILLRMIAFQPAGNQPKSVKPSVKTAPAPEQAQTQIESQAVTYAKEPVKKTEAQVEAVQETAAVKKTSDTDWAATVEQLGLGGILKELAMHCALKQNQGDVIILALDPVAENLNNKERQARLQESLCEYYGKTVRVQIDIEQLAIETPAERQKRKQQQRQSAAEEAIQDDTTVQKIMETFNASLEPGTVQPID